MKMNKYFAMAFAALAMTACSNEENPGETTGGGEVVEGIPTLATFDIKFNNAGTRAGDLGDNPADESVIKDLVLYIYQDDGSMAPEKTVYVADATKPGGTIVVTTISSGKKKIFAVANTGKTVPGDAFIPTDGTIPPQFADLNKQLWAGTSLSTEATATASADVLIKRLAGGAMDKTKGKIWSTDAGTDLTFLMSNWDGQDDGATKSGCSVTLEANIKEADLALGKNNVALSVQRAVAKIGLNLKSTIAVTDGKITVKAGEKNEGVLSDIAWTVGNVSKTTSPLQMWDNTLVSDFNYSPIPMYSDKPANTKVSAEWQKNFDNTRVFGTTNTPNVTSDAAYAAMTTGGKPLSKAFDNYFYCTENANATPASEDNSTYVIFKGKYAPAKIITAMKDLNVGTGEARYEYTYSEGAANEDKAYHYLVSGNTKVFFASAALMKTYYNGVVNGVYDITKMVDVPVELFNIYTKGICFYRIFIKDEAGTPTGNKVLVRRNHIYQVTVNSINGPGSAEIGDIMNPDTPVLPADTYVQATVSVAPWHIIKQGEEVGL